MIGAALGTAIIGLLAAWLLTGLLARVAGALLILGGALGLAGSVDANGVLVLAIGALVWWAGHLHYALRHGAWKSPLAQRLGSAVLAGWRRGWEVALPAARAVDLRSHASRANPRDDQEWREMR